MVDIEDEEKMFKVIKNAFMQRRKTLLNALSNAKIFKNKEQGIEILEKLHLNINVRPENLSINDYVNITNYINNNSWNIRFSFHSNFIFQ